MRSVATNHSYATLECYARSELTPPPELALAALRRILPGEGTKLDARDAYYLIHSVRGQLARLALMVSRQQLGIQPEAAAAWLQSWGPK